MLTLKLETSAENLIQSCLTELEMHFSKHFGLLLVVSLIVARRSNQCPGKENSYLWKVETTPPIYLYGTMHVPYKTLWNDVPDNVKVAFASSDDMCLELELLDKDTLRELDACRLLPQGVTISDVLPASLVERIETYLERIKEVLPKWMNLDKNNLGSFFSSVPSKEQLFASVIGEWRKVQPAWLMYHLDQVQREHVQYLRTPVLDTFLEGAAKGLGKTVEAIEEPKDQCRPFKQLTSEQVELALGLLMDRLEKRLDEEDSRLSTLNADIDVYRCGNFSDHVSRTPILPFPSLDILNLTKSERATLQGAEDALWQAMVVRRNRRMAKTINTLIRSERNSTIFLGVGAGHFTSALNVIDRLRSKGHIIDHIPADQDIAGLPVPDNIVALGDPRSVLRLLHISPTEPAPPPSSGGFTISDELLNKVWNRIFVTTTTSAPGLRKRSENSSENLSGWREEVRDLLELENAGAAPSSRAARPASLIFMEATVILFAVFVSVLLAR